MAGVPLPPPPTPGHLGHQVAGAPPQHPQHRPNTHQPPPQPVNPHYRPQFTHHQQLPIQIQNLPEAKGTHSRALQNILRAQLAPRQACNTVVPTQSQKIVQPFGKHDISPPSMRRLPSLSTSTPNVSPSVKSGPESSLPPTPNSLKQSPLSSFSGSSPESSNQSPPTQNIKPTISGTIFTSNALQKQPLQPSIKLNLDEQTIPFGFNRSNHASAFTAVKGNNSLPIVSSSIIPPLTKHDPNSVIHHNRELPTLPRSNGIVVPTARRIVPSTSNETVVRAHVALHPMYNKIELTVKAEMNEHTSENITEVHRNATMPINTTGTEAVPNCSVPFQVVGRKRSLDSCYEERQQKAPKIEIVHGGPSSLPSSSMLHKREPVVESPPILPQEDKDMWRPW